MLSLPDIGFGTSGLNNFSILKDPHIQLVDTASIYKNEGQVGSHIREDIFLITKLHWKDHPFNRAGVGVTAAYKASVKLLGREPDMYMDHWPGYTLTAGNVKDRIAVWKEMYALKNKQLKWLGACNYTVEHLKELAVAGYKPDAIQMEIHPLCYQKQEIELIKYCNKNNIKVISFSPTAKGKLFTSEESPWIDAHEILSEHARIAGVPLIQLLYGFAKYAGADCVLLKTEKIDHYTELAKHGYNPIATSVFEDIIKNISDKYYIKTLWGWPQYDPAKIK